MAVTGLILVGFVIAHMVGNLLVFQGPEAASTRYGAFLHEHAAASLWAARLVLLAGAGAPRRGGADQLTRLDQAARPVGVRQARAAGRPRWSARRCAGAACCSSSSSSSTSSTSRSARVHPGFRRGQPTSTTTWSSGFQVPWVALVLPRGDGRRSGCTCTTGSGAVCRTPGPEPSVAATRSGAAWRWCWRSSCLARASSRSRSAACLGGDACGDRIELKLEGPGRPARARSGTATASR